MSHFRRLLLRWAVPVLIRVACVFSLLALALTAAGILMPRPLLVMAASSIGQGLILLAFGCYALAVLADTARTEKSGGEERGAEKPGAEELGAATLVAEVQGAETQGGSGQVLPDDGPR